MQSTCPADQAAFRVLPPLSPVMRARMAIVSIPSPCGTNTRSWKAMISVKHPRALRPSIVPLFRSTNLQAHIACNAAARQRQAAAQIDRCCRAEGRRQHLTRCFGRSCHEPRPKRCGPLLAERAAYHAGTAFGRDAVDTLVACRDGLPDRQQQTREQVELCRGGFGQRSQPPRPKAG